MTDAAQQVTELVSGVESSLEMCVIRCGCGAPATHLGKICPKPKEIIDIDPKLGITVEQTIERT